MRGSAQPLLGYGKTISKLASEEDWLDHLDPDAVRPVLQDGPEPPRIAVRFLVSVQPLLSGDGDGRWLPRRSARGQARCSKSDLPMSREPPFLLTDPERSL
jgi:hypothetical protein